MKKLIKKILMESDFDWIKSEPGVFPLDVSSLKAEGGGDLYTFFFYPSITLDEYIKYVAPSLNYYFPEYEDKVPTYEHLDNIDHVEVQMYHNQINAGSVYADEYVTREDFLGAFGDGANDGNEIFNIR